MLKKYVVHSKMKPYHEYDHQIQELQVLDLEDYQSYWCYNQDQLWHEQLQLDQQQKMAIFLVYEVYQQNFVVSLIQQIISYCDLP